MTLKNQSEEVLQVGNAKATAEELLVKMEPTALAKGDEMVIELAFTPKPGKARFSGYVLVPVKGIPRNELRIPVYATITE